MYYFSHFIVYFSFRSLFTLTTSRIFPFFLSRQPQGVLLHRFPPLKPCANEFSLPFSYTKTLARHWRDLDATLKHNKREKKGICTRFEWWETI
jgi:hypothetical protein